MIRYEEQCKKSLNDFYGSSYGCHETPPLQFLAENSYSTQSYAYFPIILKDEAQTIELQKALSEKQIFPRRYFYPSLDTLSYIEPKQYAPISRDISSRILALPMYPELREDEQAMILGIIEKMI